MKIGNLSKAALIVSLMMGQVSPPSNINNFYEEDENFNTTSSVLSSGWGWGLNKAYAYCDSFE